MNRLQPDTNALLKADILALTFTRNAVSIHFFESRTMTRFSVRVPAALQEKVNTITQTLDAFCNELLNHEHRQLLCLAKDGA